VLALGSPPLVCEYRYQDGATQPAVEPPREPGDVGYSLSVRRVRLDGLLVGRATSGGCVQLLERAYPTGLLWRDGRVVGAQLRTAHGPTTVRARCLVGADGRQSAVARAVRAGVSQAEPGHRAIYYQYVRGFSSPFAGRAVGSGAEFHRLGDELAYAFPSDAGLTCVALSVNLAEYTQLRTSPNERFRQRLARHRGLAERLAASQPISRVVGCATTRNYVRVPIGPGWALLGDAGLHQDPWSGLGIDNAMVQAAFMAEALVDWLGGATTESEALDSFHRRRDADALAGYRRTVALSRDLRQLAA
jgi:flavin-dependent dehydrogenase